MGLDYLTVESDKPVTIEAVSLVGGSGGLRVVEPSMAPAAEWVCSPLRGEQTNLPAGFARD
jgi:hypothetical protein